MKRLLGVLCAVLVLALALPAGAISIYGDFDWRQNGGNFVTPIRNQGGCGSCWAFGATAALESQFLINDNTPGLNLNLSEQHLLCEGSMGSCGGGYEYKAVSFFVSDGITDESTLPYRASDTSSDWPLTGPYTLYKTTARQNFFYGCNTTTGIKNKLIATGPLPTAIHTDDWYTPQAVGEGDTAMGFDFSVPELYQGESDILLDPLGGINHCVTIVGYKDDSSMDEGGFWIVKNSWGAGWGDSGYGFFKYGDIEKHSRTHAITGDTYTVLIPPPNYSPIAVDDAYCLDEDGVLALYAYEGILINDSDVETAHADLTAEQVWAPRHGTLTLGANGWLDYTPNDNYYGTDSFTYRVFDGELYSDQATVSLEVRSVNDVSVAVDDSYEVDCNGTLMTYAYNGLLANDSDADNTDSNHEENDRLTAVLQSDPEHGDLVLGSSGWFTYTPDDGFAGTDRFTYAIFDGTDWSDLATVLLEVLATLQVPGDATGDGTVDKDDAALLANHWGQSGATWEMGDFDGDGIVGPGDAVILAAHWGFSSEAGPGEAIAVPEPSSFALLLILAGGLCLRRRQLRQGQER